MIYHTHCAACCIASSINSPLPGMPDGKPAGVCCLQLKVDNRCAIFGRTERPAFCGTLQPTAEMCGESREQAITWLARLEHETKPTVYSRHHAPHNTASHLSVTINTH